MPGHGQDRSFFFFGPGSVELKKKDVILPRPLIFRPCEQKNAFSGLPKKCHFLGPKKCRSRIFPKIRLPGIPDPGASSGAKICPFSDPSQDPSRTPGKWPEMASPDRPQTASQDPSQDPSRTQKSAQNSLPRPAPDPWKMARAAPKTTLCDQFLKKCPAMVKTEAFFFLGQDPWN